MNQQLRDWAKEALEMLSDNHHLVADNEKHRYVMMHLDVIKRGKALLEQPTGDKLTPVKAQPAAWVGLTNEEIGSIAQEDGITDHHRFYALVNTIEAKLREKNGGAAPPADHTEEYLDMVRALERLLVVQDELCSVDHHGYCQSHYLDNVNHHGGCRVANARALVAKVRGKL